MDDYQIIPIDQTKPRLILFLGEHPLTLRATQGISVDGSTKEEVIERLRKTLEPRGIAKRPLVIISL